MELPRDSAGQRLLVVLVATGAVAFVLWGAWMVVLLVAGGVGWLFSAVGGLLQDIMQLMASIHGTVAIIGLVCGALLGALLASDVSLNFLDRIRSRLRRTPSPNAAP